MSGPSYKGDMMKNNEASEWVETYDPEIWTASAEMIAEVERWTAQGYEAEWCETDTCRINHAGAHIATIREYRNTRTGEVIQQIGTEQAYFAA